MADRFERQCQFLGDTGQARLRGATVGVVGAGGLGSMVVLELAYLGLGSLVLVDPDGLDVTNRNRLVGAWEAHEEGTPKVRILKELVSLIDSSIEVEVVSERFPSEEAKEALSRVGVVMGCVDRDGVRFELNEFCCRRGLPLIDAATDTIAGEDELYHGGRVCVASVETGCLACFGVLNQEEIRADLASPEQRADDKAIYGVPRGMLGDGGPSVISVNGVVASLAVTELMVFVTGLRRPFRYRDYRGHEGMIRKVVDREGGCFYCGLRP